MQVSDADGAKPTVVVVENDAALVGALKFALELEGFGVAHLPQRRGGAGREGPADRTAAWWSTSTSPA